MTATTKTDTLTLPCDLCKKPVTGKAGYIIVDRRDIHRYREASKAWKSKYQPDDGHWHPVNLAALLDGPDPAPWHIYHRACDPDPDDNSEYWFDAYRCSTAFDLLGWTAHLLGKKWLEDTDWDEFIYRVLRANGWRDC